MFPFFAFVAGIAAAVGGYFLLRHLRRKRFQDSLGFVLFQIKLPKALPSQEKNAKGEQGFKDEIIHTEQLLTNLSSFKKHFVLEIAVAHVGEEIQFYLSVPRRFAEVAVKQVQGLWPAASVIQINDDYTIFNPNGATAGAYVLLKDNSALPIRTYNEINSDTFNAIVGAFAKVNEIGEGAALQLVCRPAGSGYKKNIQDYIRELKKGESLEHAFKKSFFNPSEVVHALNPKEEEKEKREHIVDDDAVKALQAKLSKPLLEINLRLVTSAATQFQANDILDGLIAGFHQFSAPQRNEFKIVKVKNPKNLSYQFVFRNFEGKQTMVLNTEEIASFYHLPVASTETPRISWLRSKEAAPPDNLPKEGTHIGYSVFRGVEKPIYLADADRERHMYVVGQTGTGKSTVLGAMMLEDLRLGKGFAAIDPHGDLADGILKHIPKERLDDIIYFSPADLQRPIGINMLEYNMERPEEKTFIVNEMLQIFDRLYDLKATGGPMFEQYMRNSLLLLMEDMVNEPATLIEVPRIFTDAEYRRRKLARCRNTVVVDFWEKEAVKAGGDASLANMTPYITSKFGQFITNDYMRVIIGQSKSAFSFRQVMDEGKILLINLSKGRIGDINANLLGMIFTGKLLMAALSRTDVDSSKRRTFNLYIDEFQNFTTDSISIILSEARKYKLTLNIAHQFIAQLTEKIRDSVFGNVGNMVVYRVGAQDAEFLVKQFEPTFSQNDLINVDNLHAFVKLLIGGQTARPFNMKASLAYFQPGNAEIAEKYKEYSRLKYGMDRRLVDDEIYRRLRE